MLTVGGVVVAASVWAATVVGAGATPAATSDCEAPVAESRVARGGEVEPLAPTAAAASPARAELVSDPSSRPEWSPKRGVIDRAPAATVPGPIGLALEAASAGGSEAWPSPLTEPWLPEPDDGMLASTLVGCDGVKSDGANPGLAPTAASVETASVGRDAKALVPTPGATALPQ
jgi:hypothetical protein